MSRTFSMSGLISFCPFIQNNSSVIVYRTNYLSKIDMPIYEISKVSFFPPSIE